MSEVQDVHAMLLELKAESAQQRELIEIMREEIRLRDQKTSELVEAVIRMLAQVKVKLKV